MIKIRSRQRVTNKREVNYSNITKYKISSGDEGQGKVDS